MSCGTVNVIALDPGVSTGWALGVVDRRALQDVGFIGAMDEEHGLIASGEVEAVGENENADDFKPHELYELERYAGRTLIGLLTRFHRRGPDESVWATEGLPWHGLDAVVMEDYLVYESKGREIAGRASALSPVRMAAMIGLGIVTSNERSWDGGWLSRVPLHFQMASLAKTTVTNDRLRRWGIWTVGAPHGRDAIRHLVTFMRRVEDGSVKLGG